MKAKNDLGKKTYLGFQIVAVGVLTGALSGLVVTCYLALAELCEEFSRGYYGFFRENPAFVPLLFLALFAGSIVIGGVLRFLPAVRGTGFAQTEGATRGLFRFKWYEGLTGMFAASLFTVFCGLSAGVEGPSAMIGGSCGNAVSGMLRRNALVRRYEITGGACAGLAVALNAPLTGMVFAYEEAHKRFTPEVFVCSFSSVVVAVTVRTLLAPLVGLSTGPFFAGFSLAGGVELFFCLYALGAALAVSLVGVGFYFLLFAARKLFRRLTFWKGMGKYTVPFLLAGAAGLLTSYAMGGGVHFIEDLASGAQLTNTLFSAPIWAILLAVLVLRLVVTVANVGSDLPCCASVPMMAMGASLGGLMSLLFGRMGMDPALSDTLVILCAVTFFTTVVKAPITGIVMVVELTWDFSFLLPAVLCVAVGYLVGDVFRTEPLYEKLLDEMLAETAKKKERLVVDVTADARSAGRQIRDILWPFSALVVEIRRGGERIVPKGGTVLEEGDVLLIEGTPADRKEYLSMLEAVAGKVTVHAPAPEESAPSETPEAPPDEGSDEKQL